ncbi:MAG: DUF1622 domain-containing protein [Candidatus Dormibacteria bacterium]
MFPLLAETDVSTSTFADLVDYVGRAFEAAGVVVVIIGCLLAFLAYGVASPREEAAYRALRRGLGRAILLGLELFVAGDIIRTVTVNPSFTSAGVLAIIVAIRTFLSFTLEVEIDGRWPWQKDRN